METNINITHIRLSINKKEKKCEQNRNRHILEKGRENLSQKTHNNSMFHVHIIKHELVSENVNEAIPGIQNTYSRV